MPCVNDSSRDPRKDPQLTMDSNINTTQKTLAADDKSCDSSGSSSRKRSYEESTDSVQNNVKMFRLEAIFHPKFENENQNEKLIRAKMKSKVQSKQGYLEVSLKHSGSLLLWSGGRRFYSKNSTDNKFSLSGEIILRQHFRRAQASFQECSSFVENKRLTLSFEVVTSFLGDHGERPKRDFLILTAVADRNEERFYSTVELIEMAQRFRLPHNDVFVFSNDYSTEKLFGFYDESREVGLATPVIDTLTETSDYCVKSLYPHSIFQGEIIEGFVVRYVSYQKHICIEKLRDLEARSLELLDRIPPKHPDGWDMPGDDGSQAPSYLRVNLRELADCNDFEGRIRKVLQDAGDRSLLPVEKSKLPDMIAIAERLQDSSDVETKRIAKVLNTVRKINARVDFSVSRETVSKGLIQRRVCILHVAHDGSFQKFRTHMESRDMPLYRGFVITLVDDEYYLDPFNPTKSEQDDPQDDGIIPEESLMLKMKFLPYMIRTFCCRNALQFLKKGGEPTFLVNVSAQMRRWNISKDAFEKWKAFLKAWAFFMKNRLGVEEFSPTEKYLDHLEEFQELYASGAFDADTHTCDFSGIIVVVGPDDDLVARIVDFLASRLSGTRIVSGRSIDVDWDLDGTGFINRLALNDLGKMRQLMKTEGRKFLVRCGSLPNISEFASKNEKKLQGLWEGWKSITGIPSIDVDSDEVKEAELEIMFQPFIQKVKKEKTVPNHEQTSYPSLLAFFPMIPGCGKSSLVCSALPALSESVQRKFGRSCAVIVGDKTPGKFWAAVKKEMRNNHGVVIADKNAPVSSINAIADVCARGNTFGVPVLPDSSALQTTEVVGSRYPDGIFEESRVHFYPFSLSFLAVCLARVYQRPPYSHQGKLDVGQATRPGMILLRFFGFYRQISCDALVDSLESSFEKRGATMLKPIELPFFSDKIELHPEVDAILREGLQAQVSEFVSRPKTCVLSSLDF